MFFGLRLVHTLLHYFIISDGSRILWPCLSMAFGLVDRASATEAVNTGSI